MENNGSEDEQIIEAMSGDDGTDTFSIDESITNYRIENGRRYHAYKDGLYWAPNDEIQNENLDIGHHKFLLLLDGNLLLAPVPKDVPIRVLDLGTGTGIWAIDFADEYPLAEVLGIDLSPIQPTLVPPNCRFEIDDMRDQWTYPPNYYDFVHIRGLYGSINDWPDLYKQAFKHMKPGAFIEHVEIGITIKSDDGTVTPDSPLTQISELFAEAGKRTGKSFQTANIVHTSMESVGFVNIVEKIYKSPIGAWPQDPKLRELGRWSQLGAETGLEGHVLATLTRVFGWNLTQIHVFIAHIRAAFRDRKIHSYHEIHVVYAQKPA